MTSGKVRPGGLTKGQGAERREGQDQRNQASRELYHQSNCTVTGPQGDLGQGTQALVFLHSVE